VGGGEVDLSLMAKPGQAVGDLVCSSGGVAGREEANV